MPEEKNDYINTMRVFACVIPVNIPFAIDKFKNKSQSQDHHQRVRDEKVRSAHWGVNIC